MITFLVSDLNRNPLRKLIRRTRGKLPPMQILDYSTAFRRLAVPMGTLVFTDFDLLSPFELDAAGTIAAVAEQAGPDRLRVFNHPLRALERDRMLAQLNARGLNDVQVTPLDGTSRPAKYPVFIRIAAGCEKPDTGLIRSEDEFEAALAALATAGRPLRGRIAVSFEAEPDPSGHFRKYGVFRIGDAILPQHILRSRGWHVKSTDVAIDDAFAAEELAFLRENPHRDALMALFDASGYEFGRADYTIRNGRIALFEINSNPSFPDFRRMTDNRSERRAKLLVDVDAAFRAIDTVSNGHMRFELNEAIAHYVSRRRWPSLERRLWNRRLQPKGIREPVFGSAS